MGATCPRPLLAALAVLLVHAHPNLRPQPRHLITAEAPTVLVEPPASFIADTVGFGFAQVRFEGLLVVSAPYAFGQRGRVFTFDANFGFLDGSLRGESSGDIFGWSLATAGGLLFVGSPGASIDDDAVGAVGVYSWDAGGGVWLEQDILVSTDPDDDELFGISVAAVEVDDLIHVAVGASGYGPTGAVFCYAGSVDDGVIDAQRLTPPAGTPSSAFFGTSLAIDGTTLAVGVPEGGEAGSVVVYTMTSSVWTLKTSITLSAANAPGLDTTLTEFGTAVGLSGSRLVVGAVLAAGTGSAYVFDVGGTGAVIDTGFTEAVQALGLDASSVFDFGDAVTVLDGVVAVGSYATNSDAGRVWVFTRLSSGAWESTAVDADGSTWFGASVAIEGDTSSNVDLFAGAPFTNAGVLHTATVDLTAVAPPDSPSDPSSDGLSVGAVAAIAAGSAVVGIILVVALLFLCGVCHGHHRRKVSQDVAQDPAAPSRMSIGDPSAAVMPPPQWASPRRHQGGGGRHPLLAVVHDREEAADPPVDPEGDALNPPTAVVPGDAPTAPPKSLHQPPPPEDAPTVVVSPPSSEHPQSPDPGEGPTVATLPEPRGTGLPSPAAALDGSEDPTPAAVDDEDELPEVVPAPSAPVAPFLNLRVTVIEGDIITLSVPGTCTVQDVIAMALLQFVIPFRAEDSLLLLGGAVLDHSMVLAEVAMSPSQVLLLLCPAPVHSTGPVRDPRRPATVDHVVELELVSLDGTKVSVPLPVTATLVDVKATACLELQLPVPPEDAVLLLKGDVLQNEEGATLESLGLRDGDSLVVVVPAKLPPMAHRRMGDVGVEVIPEAGGGESEPPAGVGEGEEECLEEDSVEDAAEEPTQQQEEAEVEEPRAGEEDGAEGPEDESARGVGEAEAAAAAASVVVTSVDGRSVVLPVADGQLVETLKRAAVDALHPGGDLEDAMLLQDGIPLENEDILVEVLDEDATGLNLIVS